MDTGDIEVDIRVAARRNLQALASSGHEQARRDPSSASHVLWPWPMPVKLVYDHPPSFELPLDAESWGDDAERSLALLPRLVQDLAA